MDGRVAEMYRASITACYAATTVEEVVEMIGAVLLVWVLMVQVEKEKDVPAQDSPRSAQRTVSL